MNFSMLIFLKVLLQIKASIVKLQCYGEAHWRQTNDLSRQMEKTPDVKLKQIQQNNVSSPETPLAPS